MQSSDKAETGRSKLQAIKCFKNRKTPKVIPWFFSAIDLDKLVLNRRENRRLIFIMSIVERERHLLGRSFSSQYFFLNVYGGKNRNCIFTLKFPAIDCVIAGALVLRRRFL